MRILAIDPGTHETGYVTFTGATVVTHGIMPNESFVNRLPVWIRENEGGLIVCEQIESFGMPVGREVFETVRWTGRYEQAALPTVMHWMPRRTVKIHLCQSPKAKDPNIRRALLDKFGGDSAMGTKKMPGPLYGLKAHEFAALAVAVTFYETRGVTPAGSTGETTEF